MVKQGFGRQAAEQTALEEVDQGGTAGKGETLEEVLWDIQREKRRERRPTGWRKEGGQVQVCGEVGKEAQGKAEAMQGRSRSG